MKAIFAVVVCFIVAGCVQAPKPQARFWIEPSDPDIRMERDGQFLQKAKMSQRKKKAYPGAI